MSRFAENLAGLPTVDHLPAIRLQGPDGQAESILNQPGSQGSVRVYAYLVSRHGSLDAAAAAEGLVLYAEHTEDGLINPGKHPNIDRLLAIQADGRSWQAELQPV